jgi:predicted Fe-S protein YdhL (DUF1289 family)
VVSVEQWCIKTQDGRSEWIDIDPENQAEVTYLINKLRRESRYDARVDARIQYHGLK